MIFILPSIVSLIFVLVSLPTEPPQPKEPSLLELVLEVSRNAPLAQATLSHNDPILNPSEYISDIVTTRFFVTKPKKYGPIKSRMADLLLLSVRGMCKLGDIMERSGVSTRDSDSLWCLPPTSLELHRQLAIFKLKHDELWPRSSLSPNLSPLEFMAVKSDDFIPPYPGPSSCLAPRRLSPQGLDASDGPTRPQSKLETRLSIRISSILSNLRSPKFQVNQASWIRFWTGLSVSIQVLQLFSPFVILWTCSVASLLFNYIPDPSWIILSLILALILNSTEACPYLAVESLLKSLSAALSSFWQTTRAVFIITMQSLSQSSIPGKLVPDQLCFPEIKFLCTWNSTKGTESSNSDLVSGLQNLSSDDDDTLEIGRNADGPAMNERIGLGIYAYSRSPWSNARISGNFDPFGDSAKIADALVQCPCCQHSFPPDYRSPLTSSPSHSSTISPIRTPDISRRDEAFIQVEAPAHALVSAPSARRLGRLKLVGRLGDNVDSEPQPVTSPEDEAPLELSTHKDEAHLELSTYEDGDLVEHGSVSGDMSISTFTDRRAATIEPRMLGRLLLVGRLNSIAPRISSGLQLATTPSLARGPFIHLNFVEMKEVATGNYVNSGLQRVPSRRDEALLELSTNENGDVIEHGSVSEDTSISIDSIEDRRTVASEPPPVLGRLQLIGRLNGAASVGLGLRLAKITEDSFASND